MAAGRPTGRESPAVGKVPPFGRPARRDLARTRIGPARDFSRKVAPGRASLQEVSSAVGNHDNRTRLVLAPCQAAWHKAKAPRTRDPRGLALFPRTVSGGCPPAAPASGVRSSRTVRPGHHGVNPSWFPRAAPVRVQSRSPVESGRTRITGPVVRRSASRMAHGAETADSSTVPAGARTGRPQSVRWVVGVGVRSGPAPHDPGFLRSHGAVPRRTTGFPGRPRRGCPPRGPIAPPGPTWSRGADPSSLTTTVESPPWHRACDIGSASQGVCPSVAIESVNSMSHF